MKVIHVLKKDVKARSDSPCSYIDLLVVCHAVSCMVSLSHWKTHNKKKKESG